MSITLSVSQRQPFTQDVKLIPRTSKAKFKAYIQPSTCNSAKVQSTGASHSKGSHLIILKAWLWHNHIYKTLVMGSPSFTLKSKLLILLVQASTVSLSRFVPACSFRSKKLDEFQIYLGLKDLEVSLTQVHMNVNS